MIKDDDWKHEKMRVIESSRFKYVSLGFLLVGLSFLFASNLMVNDIDNAPIPTALERWGPDGYSFLHVPLLFFGSLVVLLSGVDGMSGPKHGNTRRIDAVTDLGHRCSLLCLI